MSKRQSKLFGRVKRKNSQPEFELTEQHVPPPPPQKSRSFSDMKKDTLKKIKQEEEEQKEVAKQIEQEVQAYNAHFGYYRTQNAYGFRVSTDAQGNFYVRNNIQSNSNFERFFETENINFNHYLSQQRSDLFYHLDSQKTGGTSDYDDQNGNFSATKFKRMYYQMDREFRQYFRVQDKEYRAFLDSLDEKQVFQEYEKYNALFYLDGKMDNYQFSRNEVYFIAYIPSDAGKSTLFRDFKHYYFDLDHLLSVGKKKHKKFLFLSWLSETMNDYRYIHNFWKHQIYLNRKLLRGKILLAHNPAQVPENMRRQSYELKMMVQRPSLSSYRYHFDYQLLDSYFTDVQKVFLSYQDLHFFLYNTAVHLGYNPIKFR